jgi:ABC-2 type transport system permease protein
MLTRLLRHEWRSLSADASVWVVIGVFAAAIAYNTVNGVRWVAFQRAAIAEAKAEEQDRFRRHEAEIARITREHATVSAFADPRNPDAVGRTLGGRYAILPATTLAPLAIGQSDLLPSYFKMSTGAKETVLAAAELENPPVSGRRLGLSSLAAVRIAARSAGIARRTARADWRM